MDNLFFTVTATSSPEGEIVANLPRAQSIGKLRRQSKHDLLVAVSITRTPSRLTSSGPDIPKVVMVWKLSRRCWNLGTFLLLNSNNLRLPSADDVPPHRGPSDCAMRLKDPLPH
jgi:hypothetical protein